MSAQQDISLWEFLESKDFNSTQNLNLLATVLLQNKDVLMNAYGWEYEEWINETEDSVDVSEDAQFNALNQEEREYDEYIAKI